MTLSWLESCLISRNYFAQMDTWLAVLVVIIVVCIKYVWDIPTEETFPYKILYRCVYLYGVISYTAARMMSYVNGKNFAENYRTFLTMMIPTAKETESTTSDVLVKTTEFDGIEVRQYQNVRLTVDGERPAFLFIHGGGYVLSSPGVYDDLLKLICRDLGYYVAQIHYTLAPEGKFPRAYNDCLTACLWFFRNSERFSVNPHRVVISGDSMGGQIAASVVQALCKDPPSQNQEPKF
ncbi:putative neutral cholesterol ester hydrolase 1 [Apostichopus japonicus]|uniref:Putative neutral cholesterol ester hydrolase 1 n=1 Tax=Stichopus japonicus TaxID=307972 RepID=A0A2G8KJ86_STIJA|nr:putative neutral cholesterol ester hydrolase 1 [Apostichopus japonicus]